ncbi:family 16 glycosylhydrolase [Cellvibrio sp.]|uniref:family 16 glycosylhydrolase n=1 Tax=Cellvibrio sp. TaxID=1965322 RepID=UPI00396484E7
MRSYLRLSAFLLGLASTLVMNQSIAKPYKGAELYSNQSYQYGRYEMRMRVAKASGVLSTFFTYKNGSEVANTFWEEIDIEVFGKNNATEWQSNIILGTQRPTLKTEVVHTAASSLADAYHTYTLEWTPDYVAWYLDGAEVRRINGTSTVTSLTNPQSIRFNLWSSIAETWVGPFDDSQLPVYQFINYLDYKAYNTTTKTFEGGWRDDFNSFDSSRWGKANWTFDENRVDFVPENIVVKDGILVLALTKEGATGFSGNAPADDTSSTSSSSKTSSSAATSSSVASSSSSVSSSAASSNATSSSLASSSASSAQASSTPTNNSGGSSGGGSSGGGAIGWIELAGLASLLLIRRRV